MKYINAKYYDKELKKWLLYPHLSMKNTGNGIWKCDYCKETGKYNELSKIACTERPKPCKWCGESPLCARDCVGIRIALSDPKVYVIGNIE